MARRSVILVQTEDESMAQLLPAILTALPDIELVMVQTAAQAAEYLRNHRPDLVMLDLDWPHVFDLPTIMNLAHRTLETIRAGDDGNLPPTIGLSSELARCQMLDLGLTEGIRKPFDVFDFETKVEHALGR